jgi:hypothetical protein
MFFNPLTAGRASARAARSVALALICGQLAGCTIERAVQEPPLQRFVWYRFLNGDDIRETCVPGSLWRYRLVYNGRYQEQLRRYEVIADGGGGAHLVSQVQGAAFLVNVSPSEITAPWRWRRAETRLGPSAVAEFQGALDASGLFGPAPVGLRLPSAGFYWIAVGCRDGRIQFNAWSYPSARFAALAFPEFLFARDGTGVAVNPPREIDASELVFKRPPRVAQDQQAYFWLTVGEDGLKGF